MARLELRLFGPPRLELDGEPVKLDRRKAEALLAYLVVEPGEHRRAELAALLWPELAPAKARAALRRTLRSLTEALGSGWFVADRETLAVRDQPSIWCDVVAFERKLDAGDLAQAVALYRGEFLSELTLRDACEFDEWQRTRGETLRVRLSEALRRLVERHSTGGDEERALSFAERWTHVDPLDEPSHEAAMRLLIAAGRRGAALRLYDAFAERLDRELGIEPPRSMRALRQSRRPASSGHTEPRESAWRSACASRSVDVLDASLDAMYASADREGRYREGITLLDEAFGAVEDGPLLGRLFSRQAVLYGCIGQLAKARALLEAALPLATCDEEQAFCENRLGGVVFAEGRYALARRYLRASAKRYRAADNSAGLAWTLNVLGHLSIGTTASTKILVDCLARSRRAKDDGRIASTLNSLGKDAYVRGDLARARRFLVKGLSRRRALGHRIGIADSLNNLGNVHIALGQTSHASTVLEEALDIAKRIHARPILAEILIGLATIRDARGEPAHAARLAAAAYHLPGGWRDAKERAERTLKHCATRLAPSTLAGAVASGKTFDL